MTVTLDTSAVIAVITNEAHKPALVAVTRGADLVAPASLPAEVGNAFSAMLKRDRVTLAQARTALTAYRQIPIRLLGLDLARALELADRLGVYAYDAYVLTCALETDTPLLTLDGGQRAAAEQLGLTVPQLSS